MFNSANFKFLGEVEEVSCKVDKHVTKKHLYGGLPRLCDKVASRRMKLAGHC